MESIASSMHKPIHTLYYYRYRTIYCELNNCYGARNRAQQNHDKAGNTNKGSKRRKWPRDTINQIGAYLLLGRVDKRSGNSNKATSDAFSDGCSAIPQEYFDVKGKGSSEMHCPT